MKKILQKNRHRPKLVQKTDFMPAYKPIFFVQNLHIYIYIYIYIYVNYILTIPKLFPEFINSSVPENLFPGFSSGGKGPTLISFLRSSAKPN